MKEWNKEFIDTLKIFEKKSKCEAKKVCAIIVKNNNILSIGINGTLPGKDNCCDKFTKKNGLWFKKIEIDGMPFNEAIVNEDDNNKEYHHRWSLINEIHAEVNAIYKATQELKADIKDSIMYVSYCPCIHCAKMIALYGIKKVIFVNEYDDSDDSIEFLKSVGIQIGMYDEKLNKINYL